MRASGRFLISGLLSAVIELARPSTLWVKQAGAPWRLCNSLRRYRRFPASSCRNDCAHPATFTACVYSLESPQ